jgi:hypothetical protein
MSNSRVFAALALLSALSAAAETPRLSVVSNTRLTGEAADALDIRWTSDHELLLAAGKKGVFRYDVGSRQTERVVADSRTREGFFFSARLAASRGYVVTGSHFAALAYMRNAAGASLSQPVPFDVILDLDVYGDTLAVLGARRDRKGNWAPEGAIVWIGSLMNGLRDLRPLHYSEAGPGAKPLDRCHFLDTGAVRFLRDGTLLVVPAVEQGIYLYDRSGALLHTWDSDTIGFHDRCDLTDDQFATFSLQPTPRWNWLNRQTILDDVVPLPDGAVGFITRHYGNGAMHWSLVTVKDGKPLSRTPLPFTAHDQSLVRADIRGKQLAMLIVEYASGKVPDGARLAILELAP